MKKIQKFSMAKYADETFNQLREALAVLFAKQKSDLDTKLSEQDSRIRANNTELKNKVDKSSLTWSRIAVSGGTDVNIDIKKYNELYIRFRFNTNVSGYMNRECGTLIPVASLNYYGDGFYTIGDEYTTDMGASMCARFMINKGTINNMSVIVNGKQYDGGFELVVFGR